MMNLLKGFINLLDTLNEANANFGRWTAGLFLAAMVCMIIAQVGFRYLLNDSLTWTEELSKFAMVWISCLVAPYAYKHHLNVSIEMFHQALPAALARVAEIAITLLVLLISYLFFKYSLGFVANGASINAASVPLSLFCVYLCMPYAFGSLLLVGIQRLLEQTSTPIIHSNNVFQQELK